MTTYRIGEAARATGMSAHTIRFYEGRGLLPAATRTEAGYREYEDADLRLLRLIHRARSLDIPLDEVASLVSGIHGTTCGEYATRLAALVARQRTVVDERIADLQRLRAELEVVAAEAETATRSNQSMADCTCCLLIDTSHDGTTSTEAYCMPAPLTPAERFRAETIEVLQCDINARPAAPTIEDLAPHLESLEVTGVRLMVRFNGSVAAAVAAFAAAECVCCGGLGWQVTSTSDSVILSVSGTPPQLAALHRAFATAKRTTNNA